MSHDRSEARGRITAAIDPYLSLLRAGPGDEPAPLKALAEALDRLVACYHATPDVEPDSPEASAPPVDERPLLEAASAAFPELGWYALVDPDSGADQQVGLSIAAGDLAEIAADLLEVLWLFDHAGENDAIWQFRWGYRYHWGKHLHELRVYLHSQCAW